MRVLVTGGTGYVGAFVVQALLAAGHTPRLLVRNPQRVAATVGALGVDTESLELAHGDMMKAESVTAALAGVDAVIHCAASVATLNRSEALASIDINVQGTKTVIDAALTAGCDPVVYTSSIAALYDPTYPVITSDLPAATGAASPYTRSKALAEEYARERQADGSPVVIVYPGGVSGPAAGENVGDVAEGFVSMLKSGVVPLQGGAFTIIDVRDLAEVMVRALEPGRGPRRFMVGGTFVDMHEVGEMLRSVTGRRMPVIPLPGAVFRTLGRVTDIVRKVIPFDTVFTAEAMDLLTLARPTDDSAVKDGLGITYRPPRDTAEEMVKALYANERVTAKQAGKAASG
jgi:nucleoside-diphosphate-sugar epimerase